MTADLRRQALTAANPWPGLDSFDEADRHFFFGRAGESEELLRLVHRESLTVLFGRSGLGKTSLLRAGLFPLLRAEGYVPLYLRIDHAEGALPLRDQIFEALHAACDADRVQATALTGADSLWAFFNRRDVEFWSLSNRPLIPVLVFDQFEEIFTRGQETDAARSRSSALLAELGDLIENRPPAAVREALEADPAAARRFEFKRSTVKLILSFREDFLAEMESIKAEIPSLMYNRFRLTAMTGAQAYEVIVRAGGDLVDDEVARRIIRLAWKNEPDRPVEPSELPQVEIDPALLSVVCSELNRKRQRVVPPLQRITSTLLQGADREILAGFYESSMAGLDSRVRAFVENELITDRGYRDSHVLEDALTLPGVTVEAIDALIRHRLVRIDERQSTRRVELSHDVLTRVVKESRDLRRAREAEEDLRVREKAALERQRRNRRNAALVGLAAVVVAVLMVLSAVLAWRANSAEREADTRLAEAQSLKLMAQADRVEDVFDLSLLLTVEAMRSAPLEAIPWPTNPLAARFASHPNLVTFLRPEAAARSVAFSPDGQWLASGDDQGSIQLWDVERRSSVVTLKGHAQAIASLTFSPDGTRLASSSEDRTVKLWNVDGHSLLATYARQTAVVTTVEFNPDGSRLASASADGTVILWDVDTGTSLGTVTGILDLAWAPDGRLAAASVDGTVVFWNVDTRARTLVRLPVDVPAKAAFSGDTRRVAWGNNNGIVLLYDLAERKLLWTLDTRRTLMTSLALSSDGELMTTAHYGGDVLLWQLSGRSLEATLEGHDMVHSVVFGPETPHAPTSTFGVNRRALIASAGDSRTLILWSTIEIWGLPYQNPLAGDACRTANRNLSCSEWGSSIGTNKPYHKTCEAFPGPETCSF